MQFIEIPYCVQIRNDRIILRKAYEEIQMFKSKSDRQIINEENLKDNRPSGVITRCIRLQMQKIIANWIAAVNHYNSVSAKDKNIYFTFVTLTLPSKQFHTDKQLHRLLLNTFIITMQRKFKVKNYVWRAEKQKNGNLHYHILIDRYIHYSIVRREWNNILNRNGYIENYRQNQKEKYKKGFRIDKAIIHKINAETQYRRYLQGTNENWSNPNSTDIHGIKKVKNLAKYVTKYISKSAELDEKNKLQKQLLSEEITIEDYKEQVKSINEKLSYNKIDARVWGCSDSLKTLTDVKIMEDSEVFTMLSEIAENQATKAIQKDECYIYYNDNLQSIIKHYPTIHADYCNQLLQNYYRIYDQSKLYVKPKTPDIPTFEPIQEKKVTYNQLSLF